MESTIESLTAAKEDFISAAVAMMGSRQNSNGEHTPRTAAASEAFKQKWELFSVACDQAEESVESVRQGMGYQYLFDKVTGTASGSGSQSVPPVSALRLEQMSKDVRLLVMDLLPESGGGFRHGGDAHPHGPTNPV